MLTILCRVSVAHKHPWETARKIVQDLNGRYYLSTVAEEDGCLGNKN